MISRSFFCRVLLAVSSLLTFAESSSAQLLEATDLFEDLIVNNQSTELLIDLRDHFAVPGVQGQLVSLIIPRFWGSPMEVDMLFSLG